jgi:hypothetical protein
MLKRNCIQNQKAERIKNKNINKGDLKMDNALIGKTVGITFAFIGLVSLVSQHPVLVLIVVVGAGIYYVAEKIL